MILINWAMSIVLIGSLIFLNQPGIVIHFDQFTLMAIINHLYTDLVNNSFSLLLGYHEYYGKYTKYVFDHFVRKGVGLFFLALMNCFIITAIIHYIQVCILSTSYRIIATFTLKDDLFV